MEEKRSGARKWGYRMSVLGLYLVPFIQLLPALGLDSYLTS